VKSSPVSTARFSSSEHDLLRQAISEFTTREITDHLGEWERTGSVPRDLHRKAGDAGYLGVGFPEDVGGSGGDMLHRVALIEQMILSGASSGLCTALLTHGLALPPLLAHGSPAQLDRWVRPALAGRLIPALAITEPDTGSDVLGIRTTAERHGDHYVVRGTKMYITSGARADFVVTAVRTSPGRVGALSLLVIEAGAAGFSARVLDKMGWACSDTAELTFSDVLVPAANLVGREGSGFGQLMRNLPAERLYVAVEAYATAQRCFDLARDWARSRVVAGEPLVTRQVLRHLLAEMARRTDVARVYVQQVAGRLQAGERVDTEICMAKNTAVEACQFVVDQALQIFGASGYMHGTEIERHYRDCRALRLVAGTSEIMTELIARAVV
jgi:acyl-CoA dehydrogenase